MRPRGPIGSPPASNTSTRARELRRVLRDVVLVVAGEGLQRLEDEGREQHVHQAGELREVTAEIDALLLHAAVHHTHTDVHDETRGDDEEREEPQRRRLHAGQRALQTEEVRVEHEQAAEVENGGHHGREARTEEREHAETLHHVHEHRKPHEVSRVVGETGEVQNDAHENPRRDGQQLPHARGTLLAGPGVVPREPDVALRALVGVVASATLIAAQTRRGVEALVHRVLSRVRRLCPLARTRDGLCGIDGAGGARGTGDTERSI